MELQPHVEETSANSSDAPGRASPGEAGGAGATVMVVDDDPSNTESLERILVREGYRVLTAGGARPALDLLRKHHVQLVVTDLMMPGVNGVELLRAVKELSPETEVIVVTAFGSVETAVQAMREGAYDFVEKPLRRAGITKSIRLALERQRLVAENRHLRSELAALDHREIVGNSNVLRRVLEVAAQAAPSQATLLILGESGTGKELLARYVHQRSQRNRGPFVAVNCAAIPESILESELFGHERGAFTGAVARRDGRFARARGGTLFLDEVGELSGAVQVKLLRVLQEGEYEPVGGQTVRADVRVIAATNRDLTAEVEAGRFREDLYYRLNVISLTAPPLRARREDVPLLVDHFLGIYCEKNGRSRLAVDPAALQLLQQHGWPGNVRELQNAIERAAVLCRGELLTVADLPDHIVRSAGQAPPAGGLGASLTFAVGTPLADVEQELIVATLLATNGDKSLAAQLLGISIRTIYRRLGEGG